MIRAASIIAAFAVAATLQGGGSANAVTIRLRTEYASNRTWAAARSLDTALGYPRRVTGTGNLRLIWQKSTGPLRFEFQSVMSFSQGDNVPYRAALGVASLPSTLFDLTRNWQSNANTLVTNRIDRLSLSFTTANLVVKIGRQAITWGSGMVFHPADIVAPFAPNAIDTSYKPGVDMVYGQYLFDSGADIQMIAVPRGITIGGPVRFDASTYALRGHTSLGGFDANLMLARDRGDTVATLGISGSLGGASWNAEYVDWSLDGGGRFPSWLFNITNFGTWGGRNISYFGEVYHNGFGVGATVALNSLPAALGKRMSTGQVFVAGRDFLALGAKVDLNTDLSITPNALISLNDHSALIGASVNYALGENTNIVFSYKAPLGPVGTEFGGRESRAGSGIYGTPARTAILQLVRYF